MLKHVLIILALLIFAAAFRACRKNWARKVGALVFLGASFLAFFYLGGGCMWLGFLGASLWFFLPWIELLTRVRKLRLPVENRLKHREPPEDEFFPNASKALEAMSEAHFDHVTDSAWKWGGMEQYFRIHWNPEERAVSTVCLCEQENVAFAFITLTSKCEGGKTYRTTNFPFSPTLKSPPDMVWNHVPCEKNCFHQILEDHHRFLQRVGASHEKLMLPDPDHLEEEIESEMNAQIEHNLGHQIIEKDGDGHFRYSWKGLFFLWKQAVKDMVRLC